MDPFKKKKPSSKSSSLICHVCLCRKHHLLTHLVCIYPCLTWPPLAVWWHNFLPFVMMQMQSVELESLLGTTGCVMTTCVIQQAFSWPAGERKQAAFGQGKGKDILLFLTCLFAFPLFFTIGRWLFFSFLKKPSSETQKKYAKWISMRKHQFLYF